MIEKKDAHDVLDGLAHIGRGLETLPATIATCKEASEDLKGAGARLVKALATLRHPLEFAYHVGEDLVVNGKDIFEEVDDAVKQYKSVSWEAFGKDVGEAFEKLIVGESTTVVV